MLVFGKQIHSNRKTEFYQNHFTFIWNLSQSFDSEIYLQYYIQRKALLHFKFSSVCVYLHRWTRRGGGMYGKMIEGITPLGPPWPYFFIVEQKLKLHGPYKTTNPNLMNCLSRKTDLTKYNYVRICINAQHVHKST